MKNSKISDILELVFAQHQNDGGKLCVFEAKDKVPFEISRIFTVVSNGPTTRGDHAHFECSQMLVCLNKTIDIVCDDGLENRIFTLSSCNRGLLIPPGIWAKQIYHEEATVLMVVCDKTYKKEDYITTYSEFLKYKTD